MHALRSSSFASSRFFIVASSAAIELSHRADDFIELRSCQFRIDGQRDHFLRCLLTLGKRPGLVSEILEARLKMKRQRIIDRAADSFFLQVLLQFVTSCHPKGVLVVDRNICGVDHRSSDIGRVRESGVVILRIFPSRGTPAFKMRKLCEKYRCLKCIEPAVVPDFIMEVGLHSTMHAKPAKARSEILVLRNDHSSVAVSAEILGRKKAERTDGRSFTRFYCPV